MNLARRMLAAGLVNASSSEPGVNIPTLPSRAALMDLDYSLDGEPFVYVAARTDIATRTLDCSLHGQPFIGAA